MSRPGRRWRAIAGAACGLWLGGAAYACAQATPREPDSFLSRVTIAVPLFTRHIPRDHLFNDENWGAFVLYDLNERLALTAGDFINSYNRNTAFAGVAYWPFDLRLSGLRFDFGGMLGLDLSGGYKGYSSVDPLLGALSVKIGAAHAIGPGAGLLDRLGLLVTVIPPAAGNGSTAANLALTMRL